MAYRYKPVPLVVAVERDAGVADGERAAGIRVLVFSRAVPLRVVDVAVGAVEEKPVSGACLRACARTVAGFVVIVFLACQARRLELIGGVEREGACPFWGRQRNNWTK